MSENNFFFPGQSPEIMAFEQFLEFYRNGALDTPDPSLWSQVPYGRPVNYLQAGAKRSGSYHPPSWSASKRRRSNELPSNASEWNPIGLLYRMFPEAVFTEASDPDAAPIAPWFKYILEIPLYYGKGHIYVGEGRTKKSARRDAAAKACQQRLGVQFDHIQPSITGPERQPGVRELPVNAAEWSPHELLQYMRPAAVFTDLGLFKDTSNVQRKLRKDSVYKWKLTVDGNVYIGEHRSNKMARRNAVIHACEDLFKVQFAESWHESTRRSSIPTELPPNASKWDPQRLLHHMHPSSTKFTDVSDVNEQDDPWFRFNVTVGEQVYAGAGRSKRRARMIAATRACEELFELKLVDPYLPGVASKWDSRELLCYLCPSAVFMEVTDENDKAEGVFRYNLIIDGKAYEAKGKCKQWIWQQAVCLACQDLYGLHLDCPKDDCKFADNPIKSA